MNSEFVSVMDEKHVRTIALNRPAKRNALNKQLSQELIGALEGAASSSDVRVIIVRSEGPSFCAGQDLDEMREKADRGELLASLELTRRLHGMLRKIPKPLVAAVQGSALGGGAALMLGCDLVIGGHSLRIGYPEVSKGVVPGIVIASLNQHLGPKIAFEMMVLGRTLNASEALEFGLVNRIVNDTHLDGTACDMATRLSDLDPSTIEELKPFIYQTRHNDYDDAINKGHDLVRRLRLHAKY